MACRALTVIYFGSFYLRHTPDITMNNCLMTFVKTKLELQKLNKGDMLEVLLRDGEPLENVPKGVEEHGYNMIEISFVGEGIYKVIIEK
jgi:TusA-related sulfurtransferase